MHFILKGKEPPIFERKPQRSPMIKYFVMVGRKISLLTGFSGAQTSPSGTNNHNTMKVTFLPNFDVWFQLQ